MEIVTDALDDDDPAMRTIAVEHLQSVAIASREDWRAHGLFHHRLDVRRQTLEDVAREHGETGRSFALYLVADPQLRARVLELLNDYAFRRLPLNLLIDLCERKILAPAAPRRLIANLSPGGLAEILQEGPRYSQEQIQQILNHPERQSSPESLDGLQWMIELFWSESLSFKPVVE